MVGRKPRDSRFPLSKSQSYVGDTLTSKHIYEGDSSSRILPDESQHNASSLQSVEMPKGLADLKNLGALLDQ